MKTCTRCKIAQPLTEFHNANNHGKRAIKPRCKTCCSEIFKQYKRDNEKKRAYMRARYHADPERFRAYDRERYRNQEGRHARVVDAATLYRHRKKELPSERVARLEIYDRDGGRCHICGGLAARDDFHLDHLIPVSDGGGYLKNNLRVSHPSCNMSRGAGRIPAQLLLIG